MFPLPVSVVLRICAYLPSETASNFISIFDDCVVQEVDLTEGDGAPRDDDDDDLLGLSGNLSFEPQLWMLQLHARAALQYQKTVREVRVANAQASALARSATAARSRRIWHRLFGGATVEPDLIELPAPPVPALTVPQSEWFIAPPTLTVGDNKIMWEIVSSLGTLAQARECIIGEPERRVCIGCKQFTLINSAPSSYRCTNCNFTSVSVVGQHSGERVLRDYLQAEASATSVA
jgi:hypothetical protein